jgi:hypothetical protein
MSDLQNPLFDEEKEFLERKKLEYERALRGDVDHIKDQSVKVGKVALVGAGLAGGIWLITKAFSGGKKRKRYGKRSDDKYASYDPDFDPNEDPQHDDLDQDQDGEFGEPQYFTAGNGKRYKSKTSYKSAATSAAVFQSEQDQDQDQGQNYQSEQERETDDFGFGSTPVAQSHNVGYSQDEDQYREPSPFDTEDFEDDPFQDLPYDDSRRLPASNSFAEDEDEDDEQYNGARQPSMVGAVLKNFLQSDTGKVIVAQVAAVVLALVTKKVNEFFPAAKNSDLATSPGYAPAETGFSPVVSSVSLASPDASIPQPS